MYSLYYSPGAASLVVHWMLIQIGAPHELVLIDTKAMAQKSAAYLALNSDGRVPTLIVEGAPARECAALAMLLAERHPEAGLAPPPGDPLRPAYLQEMVALANTLLPAFRAWFYPDEPAGPEAAAAVQAVSRAQIEAVWDRFDGQLADGRAHLLGERLSAVDFLATMLMRWSRNMPRPAATWPHIGRYLATMRALPSLREVHAREGLSEWIDD